MNEVVLSVRGLSKIFPNNVFSWKKGVHIFEGVSFDLWRGECLGILGPNGCGKTTLIKILMGLIEPSSGEIIFSPNLAKGFNLKAKIGFGSSEERSFFWRLSVFDNLDFFGSLYCIPKHKRKYIIEYYLEYFNLKNYSNKLFMVLSSGMKQKLILIRALMHEPELLFLDEPLKNLDANSKEKFIDLIKDKLQKGSISIIFISHEITDLLKICNRIALMSYSGLKIFSSRDIEEIIEKNQQIKVRVSRLPEKDFYVGENILIEKNDNFIELIISGLKRDDKLKYLLNVLWNNNIEIQSVEVIPLKLESIIKILNNVGIS